MANSIKDKWGIFRRVPSSRLLWFGLITTALFTLSGYFTVYCGFLDKFQHALSFESSTEIEKITTHRSGPVTASLATAPATTPPAGKTSTKPPSPAKPKSVISERPRIAFWAKQYHKIHWTFPQLMNGDGGCDISFNRKDVVSADAVVFFMKSCKPNDLPPPEIRREYQVYVWFSHESPWTTRHIYRHKLTEFNNYFNWTMTYRTDSDVVAAMWPTPAIDYLMYRVGRTEEMLDTKLTSNPRLSLSEYETQVRVLLKKKKELIAWIVSDCAFTEGASRRMKYVKTLEDTGIKLSKFGKCAGKTIPFNFTVLFSTLSPYKFYLAFENSIHCQDYLTEKTVFNSYVSGSVPVIHGPTKHNAKKILPNGSYIFVEDFENMQELADYLTYLDKNDSAYMEYFKWWMDPGGQTFPRFGFNFGPSFVPRNLSLPQYDKSDLQNDWLEYERFGLYHLCRRLKRKDHIKKTNIIPNLAHWWYGKQPPECTK